MAPTSVILDVWSHQIDQNQVKIDVFLPNSLLIQLEVNRDATLLEIKEDVWEEAQKHPLYGMLHDKQKYVFICVTPTTAEQEELVDEQRMLCDIRPFQAILKLVERKGDKAEKLLNAQIGSLIGKGLHEFDALKNPEINDFRWKMRVLCEEISRERENNLWIDKVLYHYPIEVESSSKLPDYLLPRLKDGNLLLSIKLENSSVSFTFWIRHTITVEDLMEKVMIKKSHMTGDEVESPEDYIFKLCGMDKYLLGPYPISQYKFIRQMIADDKTPELTVVSIASIRLNEDDGYESLEKLERKRTYSFYGTTTMRKKQKTLSAWTIQENFSLRVNYCCKLNCEESSRVTVQLGLFHGYEMLCEVQSTNDAIVENGECHWNEDIQFDLPVCCIPRMTRLCIVVYKPVKTAKGSKPRYRDLKTDLYANPVAWVNTTVYDFKNILKTGPVLLPMWTFSQDHQTEDMLNPLGTVVSNPNVENSTGIMITFDRYSVDHSISYPSYSKMLEHTCEEQNPENQSSTGTMPHASKAYMEELKHICERDPLHQMHEQEKELLWFLRNDCKKHFPHALPKLLNCVKWQDPCIVKEITDVVLNWQQLPTANALELLDFAYVDQTVRSFAVNCLRNMSDEDLSRYLLQLVQALKHESYLHCDLVEFLLKRALKNQDVGHRLFWLLRSEMHVPSVCVRFGLILEAYCHGAVDHMKSLTRQMEALNKLKSVNEMMRIEANKKKENREKIKATLQDILSQRYYQDAFFNLPNPLNPCYRFSKIRVEKCHLMDSKMKPMYIAFENFDKNGQDIFIIYKNGDDLRQDMLTLQMIQIMDTLWKNEGLDLRMTPYRCISTDYKTGLIEVVLNAETIANIQKEKGFTAASAFKKGSLLSWLKDHNPDEKSLSKAIEEFTASCAGYSVATYVLGVADRHSDNIMVKTNGQLFHIDFGHIMGNFKEKFGIKRERVPFVLTHDFVHVITRGHNQKAQEFNCFQQQCEKAFTILRKNGSLIISLFAMMLSTGIPELTCEKDLTYLTDTLVLDLSEVDALRHFRLKFEEALRNSWKTSVNWLAHNLAKDNKMND
ncbi:phosphatidylinositol 4,5-bisphosphate 3-kinase catalytic subunit delta isoform-like isoform X2 [Centruroides sculpturatus]|uniref:phosphatidylinositol 4,5-bisphosphate 3-kinase catalytic subunit delta isoform-like isoform X1 n=1 Tax=Centruroides sculpturatus TaxID=218467 RepID=UPI000C6DB8D8|nr:phosphatidylinositol 4,5-bisphosphate 3-kinase catalytic subunit delta isoform-like isoform X1 [Centruroides sculpturatus]XP_023229588.1 phosphatidylinositol 4,5-bisphosphate 3-kinase catalytic subunit delta isoform-like isoform X2 [Centruroides sculpturatus]